MKVTGTSYKCDVPMNPQESAIWKVLVGLIGLIGLVGLIGLIGLIKLVKLIGLNHPRKMKHFAGHKRKDELWQQSFHPRQGLRP